MSGSESGGSEGADFYFISILCRFLFLFYFGAGDLLFYQIVNVVCTKVEILILIEISKRQCKRCAMVVLILF